MAQRLVLHPAADRVEAAVGDPHDMERVGDPAGVIEVRGQPGPERLGQIGGHHRDPRQPRRIGAAVHRRRSAAAVAFAPCRSRRGAAGRPGRWRRSSEWWRLALRNDVSSIPELTDPADPVGVVDQRGAVLDHRVHHRPPAHAELLGHLGHRSGELADLAARLRPGPAGQHHLGVEVLGGLRPRLAVAVRLGAPPPPLAPHQPSRPPEAGQVPHRRPADVRAPRPESRNQLQPTTSAVVSTVITNSSAVSVTSSTRKPGSPNSASTRPVPSFTQGPFSSSQPSDSRDDGGAPAPRGGPSDLPHSTGSLLRREEPPSPGWTLMVRHDRSSQRIDLHEVVARSTGSRPVIDSSTGLEPGAALTTAAKARR